MKKKNIGIIVLIVILLACIGAGGVFLIKGQKSEKIYKEKMTEGRKYFTQMKYEEAVAAFEFALKENPKEETAYISIYRVRAAQGEVEMAIQILREGYRETKSERLSELLALYIEKTERGEDKTQEDTPVETLEAKSDSITMNTAMLQKLKNYTYANYEEEFGRYISNEMQGNTLEVTHGKIEASFSYRNQKSEKKSINTAQKLPYDYAKPSSIRLANLGLLFKNFDTGITFERLQEIVGTKVTCAYSDAAESYVDSFTYNDCEIQIACEENGDIVKRTAWNQIIPPEGTEETEETPVDGVIVNAVTGKGVQGASLVFEPEDSSLNTEEVWTDRNGSFGAELAPGVYEVKVSCDGFIEDSFELEVEEGTPVSGIYFTLSPVLDSGEIRIVLTWNAYPPDLDSHLEGTSATGKNIHVYFGRRNAGSGGEQVAFLDVDETGGFGPETTTIYMDGSYYFRVEDFRHTGKIGGSGAQVKVYFSNGEQPQVFDVPQGSGNVWEVFSIENGVIQPINTITR